MLLEEREGILWGRASDSVFLEHNGTGRSPFDTFRDSL